MSSLPPQARVTTWVREKCTHCVKQRSRNADLECGFCIDGFITRKREEPVAATDKKNEPAFKIGDKVIVAASAGEYKAAWNGITGTVGYVSAFKAGEPYAYIVDLDAFVVHADKRGTFFNESQLRQQ